MGIHVFFLFLYVAFSAILPAEALSVVLMIHCSLSLLSDVRMGKKLYVMTPFFVGVILITLANLLYIIKINTVGLSEYSMYKYIMIEYIDAATVLWCVGNSCIFIGYSLFEKNKSIPSVRLDLSKPKILRGLYIFIVVFSILNLTGNMINLAFITGGMEKVLSLLNVMGILFFARLWVYEDNRKYRDYAITLTVMQTVIALYVSFLRIELLTPSISFFGGYFIGKGSLKYLFSARVVPALMVGVVFSLFFNTLAGNRAHFITAFTGGGAQEAVNSSYVDLSDAADKGEGGALERSANVAQLSNVINLVEKKGFYGGAASYPLLAAFIPRLLWPDKPTVELGTWFALETGTATIIEGGRANNSINMTIPGELYLDFGWIGIVVGGILFGGLIAMFWNAAEFVESPYNLSGTLWGGYLLLYALSGIGSDLQIVVSLTSTYFIFLIIKKVVNQRNEGISHRAALEGQ